MNFLNVEHENKYLKLKEQIGFTSDKGEYSSFAYLVSTLPIFVTVDNFNNIDKSQISNSENVILDLAISLFTGKLFDVNNLKKLDNSNLEIALNAIKIRFS
ncbi:hypothetical protein [Paraclostridium sordellii]|uniref:hypothetical protein n=1 Tax=Paraclostridium sordellii TaxID=1505 RepID=UPI0005E764B5|nr:hypothetical protein [Paeniclostridium sordellii]CEP45208.1 Uncharacterised protein [[Clostridium] sordellii] [Paeniclostridium sordellii]